MKVMNPLGYTLIDIHEHEFQRWTDVEFPEVSILYQILQNFGIGYEVDSSRGHHFSRSKFGTVFKYLQGFFQDSYRNDHNNNKDF